MFRLQNKAAYLLSLYLGLLIVVRFGTELLIRNFVASLGFEESELSRFIFDNEMNLQAFCLVVALSLSAWLVPIPWFNLTKFMETLKRFLVSSRLSDLAHLLSESLFKGFLVASLGIGLSVFLGYSVLEVPPFAEVPWFRLLPAFLIHGFLLLLWIGLIEFQRYFLFKSWIEAADRTAHSSSFFSESVVSRLGVVGFETLFYFWLLNSSPFWMDRFYVALLCLLMAAGQLLWFELSVKSEASDILGNCLRRVFVVFSLSFSLIHIFGQNIAGYKRVSWMSSFPGALREPTGNLAMGSPAGQILFALLLVFFVNSLLRRALKNH